MRSRKNNFLIAIVLLILVSISIGYAYLSGRLDINGNAGIKENSWIIYFDNVFDVDKPEGVVTDEATITDKEKTQIDFSVNLKKPGDRYEFVSDIKNDGTIDAMIESVSITSPSDQNMDYLDFRVTYLKEEYELQRCDLLPHQDKRKIRVVVEFKKDVTEDDLPEEDTEIDLRLTVTYVQKFDCGPSIEQHYFLYIDTGKGDYNFASVPGLTLSDKSTDTNKIYQIELNPEDEFVVSNPVVPAGYEFKRWNPVQGKYTTHYDASTNKVTMDYNDAYIVAKYDLMEDYVAKIYRTDEEDGVKYYKTIQAAFDDVRANEMIYLLRNTEESPTNYKNYHVTLNLNNNYVTGLLTNETTGNLMLVNEPEEDYIKSEDEVEEQDENITAYSYFENEDGYALLNKGTFTLGRDDAIVHQGGIALIGKNIVGGAGIKNEGTLNHYDGYIEGYIAVNGIFNDIPEDRYEYIDHNDIKNCQKAYLIVQPERAIDKSRENIPRFYFNLQDSFIDSMEQDLEMESIRDFEGAYPLEIYKDKEVYFDIHGYRVEAGYTITNNGTFRLIDEGIRKGEFLPSVTVINNGDLYLETIKVTGTTDADIILNKGNLDLKETKITAQGGYAINIATGDHLYMDDNTYLKANDFALYNNSPEDFTIKGGHISGIHNRGDLVIEKTTHVEMMTFGDDTYGIKNDSSVAIVTLNEVDFDVTNSGPNTYAVYNNNSSSRTVINGGNYIIESTVSNTSLTGRNGANITYGGIVTVNSGKIESKNNYGAAKCFLDATSVTINGGTVIANGKTSAVSSNSPTAVNGGNVSAIGTDAKVFINSNANVTGGHVIADGENSSYVSYTYEVSGKNIVIGGTALVESNDICIHFYEGTTTVNGGTINCERYFVTGSDYSYYSYPVSFNNAKNFGTVNINGGDITTGSHGIYGRGQLNMTNGNLTSELNGYEMYEYGSYSGDVVMTGGTITSKTGYGIHAKVASTTIRLGGNSNKEITPTVTGYITGIHSTKSGITMLDGLVEGKTLYGIYANGSTTLGVQDYDVSITSPRIKGYYFGLFIDNNVNVDMYDGVLEGITHGYSGVITGTEESHQVYEEGEAEYDGDLYNVNYLEPQDDYVRVGEVRFNSLQKAINYIQSNGGTGTMVILKDHDVKHTTNLPSGLDITLDFDGYNLNITKAFTNNGTLTMKSSVSNETTGISSTVSKPIVNNGTLTIENGKYNTVQGMLIHNKGTFTLNDGTLLNESSTDNSYVIYNESTSSGAKTTINNGLVEVTGSGNYTYAIYNANSYSSNSGLEINGGHVKATSTKTSDDGIANNYGVNTIYGGNVKVTNGTIEAIASNAIAKTIAYANSQIENGTLTATGKRAAVFYEGNATVNGGTITGTGSVEGYDFFNYSNQYSVFEVNNNPQFTATHTCIYTMGKETTINGGTFNCGDNFVYGSNSYSNGYNYRKLTITDGTVTAGNYGIYGNGELTITGGSITSKNDAVYFNRSSTFTMDGGSLVSRQGYGVYTNGKMTINIGQNEEGSYIEAATTGIYFQEGTMNIDKATIIGRTEYGVYTSGTTTFGKDEGEIDATQPSIRGQEYGLVIIKGSTTNINDGIYKGTKYGYQGFISGFPDQTTIATGEETINEVRFITNYVAVQDYFLRVGNEEFNSLQTAIDYIQNEVPEKKETIYVLASHNIKTETVVPSDVDITIDFSGYTLIDSKMIINEGILTLEDNPTIEGLTGGVTATQENPISNLIVNKNTMIINGGQYKGLTGTVINNQGDLTINDGLIKNEGDSENLYAIYNTASKGVSPTFTMNGGSIISDGTGTFIYGVYSNAINDGSNNFGTSITIEGGTIEAISSYDGNYYNYLHSTYGANGIYGGSVVFNDGLITSENLVGSSRSVNGTSNFVMNGGMLVSNGLLTANIASSSFTMNHGELDSNGTSAAYGVYNHGSSGRYVAVHNDSLIESEGICLDLNNGTSLITGGILNCTTMGVRGSLTGSYGGYNNFGTMTVTGGIINAGTYGMQGRGTLYYKNGELNSVNTSLQFNVSGYNSVAVITGGEITSSEGYGIYSNNSSNSITVGATSETPIGREPYIYGANNGIYLEYGNLYLGYKDNKVDLLKFNILGGNYGVYNVTTGFVGFYDGILKGYNYGYYGTINEIEDGTRIFEDQEIIGDLLYNINYLVKDTEIVENINTGKKYSSLELSFEESSPGDKLRLIDNVQLYYNVTIPSEVDVEFDWNGYNLVATRTITNNGNVVMYDTSSDSRSYASTSLAINIFVNNGTLDMTGLEIENTLDRSQRPIVNNGTLKLDNVTITSTNNIENRGSLTLKDSTLIGTGTAITDSGTMNIKNSTITSTNYGVYTTSSSNVTATINDSVITANGAPIYKYSGSSKLVVTNTNLNIGYVQNNSGVLEIYESTIESFIRNSATTKIKDSTITDECFMTSQTGYDYTSMTNSGTLTIEDSTYVMNSSNNGNFVMLQNSGTFNSLNTTYDITRTKGGKVCWLVGSWVECRDLYVYGIIGSGNINSENSDYTINEVDPSVLEHHVHYYGFNISGNGRVVSNNDTITMDKGLIQYGIYSTTSNQNNTLTDTEITLTDTQTQYGVYLENSKYVANNIDFNVTGGSSIYGVYAKTGEFVIETGNVSVNSDEEDGVVYGIYVDTFDATVTLGIRDGDGTQNPEAVHTDNPSIRAIGRRSGIGVKKDNGFFNFFDGIIIGNTAAKPDTTSNVEYNYEAINFYDDVNDYIFCTLDYMKQASTSLSDYVVVINNSYYRTLDQAFRHAQNGDVIRILKSIEQDGINNSPASVTLDLRGFTLGGTITNNGTLTIVGGQINGLREDLSTFNPAVINNGTLYLGVNDNEISYDEVVLLSDGTALINNGETVMYDGVISGHEALEGNVIIPPYYAVVKEEVTGDRKNIYLEESDFTVGSVYEFDYTGREEVFVAPVNGYYEIQTWGAQGGSYNATYVGGYGAYAKGIVYLEEGEILYINVGGAGTLANNSTALGGYNGGGSVNSTNESIYAGSGGGATSVTYTSGLLNTFYHKQENLLIAAGGGGGAFKDEDTTKRGGDGRGIGDNQNTIFGMGISATDAAASGAGLYGGIGSNGGSSYIGNANLTTYNGISNVMYTYKGLESKIKQTKTISTNSASEIPRGGQAKIGNGYVKITILNSEKDDETYQVTIDPTNGLYNGSKDPTVYFLKPGDKIALGEFTSDSYFIFNSVISNVEGTYNETDNTVTMGSENIIITAVWDADTNYVKARVENEYFETLQEAFDYVTADNTIYLLADVNEEIINNQESNITLNLQGNKITNKFINNGSLTLINGTIENTTGIGFINNGTLNLGLDDKNVDDNSVAIIGKEIGLKQNGRFNFYDGYLEGDVALDGLFNSIPKGYLLFADRNFEKNCAKLYLMLIPDSEKPDNAVARVVLRDMNIYYYNLQDAFNMSSSQGLTAYAIRNFDATYPLEVMSGRTVKFDMSGYTVTTGSSIVNNGDLTIKNSGLTGSLNISESITNNGTLSLDGVTVNATTSVNVINNYGDINLVNSKLNVKDSSNISSYTIYNNSDAVMTVDDLSTFNSIYSIYNIAPKTGDGLIINGGNYSALYNSGKATINGGNFTWNWSSNSNGNAIYNIGVNSYLIINDGVITAEYTGNNSYTAYGIFNENSGGYGTVEFNGGSLVSKGAGSASAQGIVNGTVKFNGGSIEVIGNGAYTYGISSTNVVVNGGNIEVTSTSNSAAGINGTFTVNKNLDPEKELTINSNQRCLNSYTGTNNVYAGTYTCGYFGWSGSNVSFNMRGGIINAYHDGLNMTNTYNSTISGGTITSDITSAIYYVGASNSYTLTIDSSAMDEGEHTYLSGTYGIYTGGYGNINLNDAIIESSNDAIHTGINTNLNGSDNDSLVLTSTEYNGIYVLSSTTTINNATIIGKQNGIYNDGVLKVVNGDIQSEGYGINSTGNVTLGVDDDSVYLTNPSIVGEDYGLVINGGSLNYYDGIIKGKIKSLNATINSLPDAYDVKITAAPTEEDYEIASLKANENFLKVGTKEFNSLQKAIDYIEDLGKIEVILDAEIKSSATFTTGKSIVLDLNGHTLDTTKTFVNNGNLTIEDSSAEKTGTINYGTFNLFENNNIMTVKNGSYKGSRSAFVNKKTFTMDDGLVEVRFSDDKYISGITNLANNTIMTINGGIVDSMYTGTGGFEAYALSNQSGGYNQKIVINDGTFKASTNKTSGSSSAYTIIYGIVEINGGYFEANANGRNTKVIHEATSTINSGTLKTISTNENAVVITGNSTINKYVAKDGEELTAEELEAKQPKIISDQICIEGNPIINGGTFTCGHYGYYSPYGTYNTFIMNGGTINATHDGIHLNRVYDSKITGGTITSKNYSGVYFVGNSSNAKLTIDSSSMNEGEYTYIQGPNAVYIDNGKIDIFDAVLDGVGIGISSNPTGSASVINVGSSDNLNSQYPIISGNIYGIHVNANNTLNVYGGTVTSRDYAIHNVGTASIYGGSFTATSGTGLYNTNKLTVGKNDSTVSKELPVFIGQQYGVKIESGNVGFYDGIGKGKTAGISGFITGLPEGYTIRTGSEEIDGSNYVTNYLDVNDDFLRVNGVTYNSFDKAIAAITGTGTIEVIGSAEIKSEVEFPGGKVITLDLGGNTLSTTKPLTINGTLTIDDSSEEKSGGISSEGIILFTNNNVMNINNGSFSGSKTVIANKKTLTIDNANITMEYSTLDNMGAIDNRVTNATVTVNYVNINATYTGTGAAEVSGIRSDNITNEIVTIKDANIVAKAPNSSSASALSILKGKVVIDDGYYEAQGGGQYTANVYMADITINGGVFNCKNTNDSAFAISGNIIINKNPVSGKNDAEITCTKGCLAGGLQAHAGTITSGKNPYSTEKTINNEAVDVVITGGTFHSTVDSHTLWINNAKNVRITGGRFTSAGYRAMYFKTNYANYSLYIDSSNMPNGEHTYFEAGDECGIRIEGAGTANIVDAVIVSKKSDAIQTTRPLTIGKNEATAESYSVISQYPIITGHLSGISNESTTVDIYDGTITGETAYGINNRGTLNIGINDGEIKTNLPLIEGSTYGLYSSSGYVNIYDGLFKGSTLAYNAVINNVPENHYLYETEETVDSVLKKIAYLKVQGVIVKNTTLDKSYNNLKDAFDEAMNEDELELLDNVELFSQLNIINTTNATLDLKGYNITSSKQIVNEGIVTITDSSQDNTGKLITSFAVDLINNKNELTLNNVTIQYNNSSSATALTNNGTLTLDGVVLTGSYYGIRNNTASNLFINNSSITTSNVGIYDYGKLIADNLTISSAQYGIYNDNGSTCKVSNSTIYSSSGSSIYKTAKDSLLELDKVTVNGANITNNGTMNIIDSTINAELYNNSNSSIMTVTNGSLNRYNYNRGNLTIKGTQFDNNVSTTIYNESSGVLDIDDITVDSTLTSTSNYYFLRNYGNVTIKNSEVTLNKQSNSSSSSYYYAELIYNYNGTITSTDNVYTLNDISTDSNKYMRARVVTNQQASKFVSTGDTLNATYGYQTIGIEDLSTGAQTEIKGITINIQNAVLGTGIYKNNSSIKIYGNNDITVGANDSSYGIHLTTTNATISDELTIKSNAVNTSYGIRNDIAKLTLLTGDITATGKYAYGMYIDQAGAESTVGTYDGSGEKTAEVEIDYPFIKGYGTEVGIGVKKVNGKFYYYDGKLAGTTDPKPEVPTGSEPNFEAVPYYDFINDCEYVILQHMMIDRETEAAKVGDVIYTSLQVAINKAQATDTIIVLKDLDESVKVASDKDVTIDFNGYTLNGNIRNNGILSVYNGVITSDEEFTILNNASLTLGIKDGVMDKSDIEVVGSIYGIKNNGVLYIYDGSIKGQKPLYGPLAGVETGYKIETQPYNGVLEMYLASGSNVLSLDLVESGSVDLPFTGDEQTFTAPEDGYYKLEVWGAQGGGGNGGYGSYSSGNVYLNKGETIYINVGGAGSDAINRYSAAGGYNGGGNGANAYSSYYGGAGGGGATHIAKVSGLLETFENNIESVLIVAGGGGGLAGGSRYGNNDTYKSGSAGGYVGTSGGVASTITAYSIPGSQYAGYAFGKGAPGIDSTIFGNNGAEGNGGSGAGLYGGYTSPNQGDGTNASGAGGSGFIGNLDLLSIRGFEKVMYGYQVPEYSDYGVKTYLTNNFSTVATAKVAKAGNGYARITRLIEKDTIPEGQYNFYPTNNEQIFMVPKTGYYKLEAWGAQGGGYSTPDVGYNRFGLGGYSTGDIYLEEGQILYINVGGKGVTGAGNSTYGGPVGGYNGGGNGGNSTSGSGGGATHIALSSGLLSSLSSKVSDVLIVAGGGGGTDDYNYYTDDGSGGSGGGHIGVAAYINGKKVDRPLYKANATLNGGSGMGGTQTQGFAFGKGESATYNTDTGGAGGGYYGGYVTNSSNGGAGGGSGYIGNSKLINKVMYCYDCIQTINIESKTIATTDYSMLPVSNYAKLGDGHVRITFVSDQIISGVTYEFDYENKEEEFIVPQDGYYKLETWGAQGGDTQGTYVGGYGAYATGVVYLHKDDILYVNVGGKGQSNCSNATCEGGYNGGGSAGSVYFPSAPTYSAGGGGATHIATVSGLLSELEEYKGIYSEERETYDSSKILIVSGGGGGSTFHNNYSTFGYKHSGGSGGGMTGYGICDSRADNQASSGCGGTQNGTGAVTDSTYGTLGSFGLGASNTCTSNGSVNRECYAPGAGGGFYGGSTGTHGVAGGGSGFIGSSKLISYEYNQKFMVCYGCEPSSSEHTKTYNTNNAYEEAKSEYAKKGNGYVRITPIKEDNISIGRIYKYDYTGSEQTFTAPVEGLYKLDVWGAQGGSYSDTYPAGYGGYSVGEIYLKKGQTIYINVGGRGEFGVANELTANLGGGGYNGGGNRGGYADSYANYYSGAGGGATSIATVSGLLSELEDYKGEYADDLETYDSDTILIVAGGGGGNGSVDRGINVNSTNIASGGGISGNYGNTSIGYISEPGTQTTGYKFGVGQGCNGGVCDGGGGGFYGGLRGINNAAGGSGYIGNRNLTNKEMYCYDCETSENIATKTISTFNVSSEALYKYAKKGDGYAMVTYLGNPQIVDGTTFEFDYTNSEKEFIAPAEGYYEIKVWGAQGGTVDSIYEGGYGGYATGIIHLNPNEKLYINVGGAGASNNKANVDLRGGYNGGGSVYSSSVNHIAAPGGGASSVAYASGTLDTLASNKNSIVIVAGGGGGGRNQPNHELAARFGPGGSGGGFIGGAAIANYDSLVADHAYEGLGGTQTDGFMFGKGEDGYGNAGGGGGYYGAYSGDSGHIVNGEVVYPGSGSGGSGYIGYYGLISKAMYCYNCTESYENDTRTISVDGASIDHADGMAKKGDGYVIITYVSKSNPLLSKTYEYDNSNTEQYFIAPEDGYYKLEVWGGQGGGSLNQGELDDTGGLGGYATGVIHLNKNEMLFVNVGGRGADGNLSDHAAGGYNGGGYGTNDSTTGDLTAHDDEASGGGGGATSIAKVPGLLQDLEDQKDQVLIVAGGGGGKSWEYTPGSGGGFKGTTTSGTSTNPVNQETGYAFGKGQDAYGYADSDGVAGGGGGWYGGYMNNQYRRSSGSGGSGYIGHPDLLSKVMYCYQCEESSEEQTKTISTNDSSNTPVSNTPKIGAGYAKIYYLKNYIETNTSFEYEAINEEQVFEVPVSGTYKLEVWGAQGGSGVNLNKETNQDTYIVREGGYGAYSVGSVDLLAGDKLYINVGGKGVFVEDTLDTKQVFPATYNGGGEGIRYANGGGATHIATSSGLLSTLSSDVDSILIVAGGGAGTSAHTEGGGYCLGGHGGGYIGNAGSNMERYESNNVISPSGSGGTQESGFAFGLGQSARDIFLESNAAGTGGGYYGGTLSTPSTSWDGCGGGGSGYIANTKLSNKAMYCFDCATSNEESKKTISISNVDEEPLQNTAKKGNGYAKITFVKEKM